MVKLVILGSGAAPGVPSVSGGWGACNPDNPKNIRQRAGVYLTDDRTQILVDTSPDLKNQLITNNIRTLDGVLYTHTHADHLHGIDDLRGITRNIKKSLNCYATLQQLDEIKERFRYVFSDEVHRDITNHPELLPVEIEYGRVFNVGSFQIMPLEFAGHTVTTTGYAFNGGQVVLIPDFKVIPMQTLQYLQQIDVNVLIMPLTILHGGSYHAGMDIILDYAAKIKAKRVILTHMATECDYDEVMNLTPENMEPAFDNMMIEL
ncbi:MAG: MBL fold metallo-hydrolase [Pseudomonadota bacterium]|nr:MBL fold metallo-hydrolase [Pseudomonadota bacterium]